MKTIDLGIEKAASTKFFTLLKTRISSSARSMARCSLLLKSTPMILGMTFPTRSL